MYSTSSIFPLPLIPEAKKNSFKSSFYSSKLYCYFSIMVLHRLFQMPPADIPQLLNEIQWQSPVHLTSGHWKCNSHILPYALLSGRKNHLAWCALMVVTQRYFASLLPFPFARRTNYKNGARRRLETARNDQARKQKGYFLRHCSLCSAKLFHWTETQAPFPLHQIHREEESLAKAKF